ncbi:unnamed protein product [Schistocephalus solidus]|uniref:Uncharacterized protein n=1 Tax=Schistocephalus solidus TaxID=70667 RepID=A0A183SB82_SCHSO|nr:unnamed protein product [Schistocephalus solidus]
MTLSHLHFSFQQQYRHQEAEGVVSPPVAELLSQSSVFPDSKTECELFRDLTGSATATAAVATTTAASFLRPAKSYGCTTTILASPPSASSLACDTFPPRLAAAAASAGLGTDTCIRNPLVFQTHCSASILGSSDSRCPPERLNPVSPASSPGRPEKLAGYLNTKTDDPISSPVAGMTASGDTTGRNV